MKQIKKYISFSILCMLILLLLGCSASAAVKKKVWVTSAKGVVSYYNYKGNKLTGKKVINGKTYCFDAKGRQMVGWQKIGSKYYCFAINKGKKAFMLTNTTVNGIKLDAKGVAQYKNSTELRKLKVMVAANKIVHTLTNYNLTMTKRDRLRKCFDYTVKTYRCYNIGGFRKSDPNWDLYYAERVLIPTDPALHADCYTYGCAMAYLANACGAKAICVSSGGHGWCDVDGYVCDPNWSMVDRCHSLFMRSYNETSRCSKTPGYKSARFYTKPV